MSLHKYSTSDEVRKHYRMEYLIECPFHAMRLHLKKFFPKIHVDEIKDHLLEQEFHELVTKAMQIL